MRLAFTFCWLEGMCQCYQWNEKKCLIFFFFFFLVSFFSHPSQLDFVYDAFPHYSTLHNYHQLQNGFKLSMEHLVVKKLMLADTETLPNKYLADSFFQVQAINCITSNVQFFGNIDSLSSGKKQVCIY
jgi:hypothetical protein